MEQIAACCVCRAASKFSFSKAYTKDCGLVRRRNAGTRWWLRSCVPIDLYSRLISRTRPICQGMRWRDSSSTWSQQHIPSLILSTGLLLTGVATFILDLNSLIGLPVSAHETSIEQASFRPLPSLEEHLREGMKQAGAVVDSAVDFIPNQEPSPEELEGYRHLINEVWEVVDANYMDARSTGFSKGKWASLRDIALSKKLGSEGAAYRAVREMLSEGVRDPYTRLVPRKEFTDLQKYDISGVGLNVGTADDFVKTTASPLPGGSQQKGGIWVLGLIKKSPADTAGVQQGDKILEIDGKSLDGVTPFEAAIMMKGKDNEGGSLTLKVLHPQGSMDEVSVERPSTLLPSPLESSLQTVAGRRIAYLKLKSFTAGAQEDLVKSIHDFEKQNATELILDLRDNRGGLVQEGLEVAKIFLDGDSTIVLTDESGAKGQSRVVAPGPPVTRLPLTVLVNRNTGSASEIMAGAVKDNCRGVLVGSKTYGKGLIQSVYALRDGAGLVLTVGKYFTPAMVDIDREGLQPDFSRIPTAESQEATIRACKLNRGQPA